MVTSMVVGGNERPEHGWKGAGRVSRAHPHTGVFTMPRAAISPLRRRVLTLRHRDRTWQEAEATLFDRDGRGLFYALCLAREGVGTRAEAHADFEASSRALLAQMIEARPDAGTSLQARWEAWWARTPRR